jgi:hypothetical protein
MSQRRVYQPTHAQDWALHELAGSRTPSASTHTRTLRSLLRAGLAREDDGEWALTAAGEREAVRATQRIARRNRERAA